MAEKKTGETKSVEENIIYVGKKPVATYCLSVNTIALKGFDSIYLKSRGQNISKAVDVALVALRKFLPSFELGKIELNTETYTLPAAQGETPKERNISTISIELKRKK